MLIAVLMIAGCVKPLPQDKQHYEGLWQAEGMSISIQVDGTLEYERVEGSSSRSINAPIDHFDGDDFVVSILFIETIFKVSHGPIFEKGQWTMTVDGVRLVRQ